MGIVVAFASEFARYRSLAEGAILHLSYAQLREPLDRETNAVGVIMKHVGGNLRSRWSEPFTSDGEKLWRDRDAEFVDDFTSREEIERHWRAGWETLEAALSTFGDADLGRELRIRGEPHTLALALARSLAHTAYHCGQIVQASRVLASRAGTPWRTMTVPRGGSVAHNTKMGYDPRAPGR